MKAAVCAKAQRRLLCRLGSFALIWPCPLSCPLSTTPDIAASDLGTCACRRPAPRFANNGRGRCGSGVLALIKLATRGAPAVAKESAYRLQTNMRQTCSRDACEPRAAATVAITFARSRSASRWTRKKFASWGRKARCCGRSSLRQAQKRQVLECPVLYRSGAP